MNTLEPRSAGAKAADVELRGLAKLYGADAAVDGIDLSIRQGEFFSLLGPSGSGKSTTLMMIAGFVQAERGSIVVGGADLSRVSPQHRGFGIVFQNYAIFPHLDVFENIAFPLRARGWSEARLRDKVTEALRLVQLEGMARKFARQLSGGQQQRVAIARAVVFDPAVILMDEPLGALDRNLRTQMQTEIKEIQRRIGTTVIYVTHDQEEAMTMSDRMAIMNRGRIVQVGEPSHVYERPQTVFAARFLGEANLLPGVAGVAEADGVQVFAADGLNLKGMAATAKAAGPAVLFVRPEKIALSAASAGPLATGNAQNRVVGKVERRAFLGGTLRYTLAVGASSRMVVDSANSGRDPVFDIGDEAVLHWPVVQTLLLPEDAS